MPTPEILNQPVLVEARFLPDGRVEPTAFKWRGRTRRVIDHGREWTETLEGTTWHCYLVRTAQGDAFELRLDEEEARWVLARAWLNEHTV